LPGDTTQTPVLIAGILLGLLLGLWSGGRLSNLATIQLRWVGVLFAAVLVRFGTEIMLNQGVEIVDDLRVPLLASGFGLLLAGLWVNRGYPGLSLAFIGILLNGIVIVVNGGFMPVWASALAAAGFSEQDMSSALHVVLPGTASDFLLNLLIIGDVFPIPVPYLHNVASLGDLFLTLGLAFFLFAGVVRVPSVLEAHEEAVIRERLAGLAVTTRIPRTPGATTVAPETGLAPALAETAALERPLVMGSQGAGLASPALAPLPVGVFEPESEPALADDAAYSTAAASVAGGTATTVLPPIVVPRPSPETVARVRRHPYTRLALNGSFSALWAGQLISLFGDRIHTIALAAVVLTLTNSVFASALVFVAATLPNLFLSPVAGTLVDRWDHKEVLVVSDLLRAGLVLLVPIAAVTNVVLVYPLVFLITTVSIFFRPARVAILPQIVLEDELLSANSALWVGETMADIIGWPLAGLFVVSLGNAIPVAFWLDAATYVGSALLLSAIVVQARTERSTANAPTDAAIDGDASASVADPPVDGRVDVEAPVNQGFAGELKAGWRFLRGEPSLLANTLQATVAQLTVGILIALTPAFALTVFGNDSNGWKAVYAFIETSQGIGSLIGGFVIGLVGSRYAKGRMIIFGYALFGFFLFLLSLTGDLGLVLGFAFGSGIANMVFLIPSQTMFQERTPPELMGRVVGFRFALVFGAMTLAMGVGGLLAQVFGVTTIIAVGGLITMAAGLGGMLVPAVRDVR
jgi:MFS family permease